MEAIYRSLRLSDEDLLDRAGRQELVRGISSACSTASVTSLASGASGTDGAAPPSDLDTMMNWSISRSFETLPMGPNASGGSCGRRSVIPDKIADDMALRRLSQRKAAEFDPQTIPAKSGSYLLMTPANVGPDYQRESSGEPDVIQDDVAFRQIKHRNSVLKVADPQPPFGIPIGPVTPGGSASDYLHTNITGVHLRPILHAQKYPDLVRDDLAFRNLRKDGGHVPALDASAPVNTDQLDDLLRQDPSAPAGKPAQGKRKKRAVRSLSANIAYIIRQEASRPSGGALPPKPDSGSPEAAPEYDAAELLSESLPIIRTPRAVKQRSGLRRLDRFCDDSALRMYSGSETEEPCNRGVSRWMDRAYASDGNGNPRATPPDLLTIRNNNNLNNNNINNNNINNINNSNNNNNNNNNNNSLPADRIPALAKLYPKEALLTEKQQQNSAGSGSGITTTSPEVSPSPCGSVRRSAQPEPARTTQKPPSGPATPTTAPSGPHVWSESPLFRAPSPANSTDSGQVSCGSREIQAILRHQIAPGDAVTPAEAAPPADADASACDDPIVVHVDWTPQPACPSPLTLPSDSDSDSGADELWGSRPSTVSPVLSLDSPQGHHVVAPPQPTASDAPSLDVVTQTDAREPGLSTLDSVAPQVAEIPPESGAGGLSGSGDVVSQVAARGPLDVIPESATSQPLSNPPQPAAREMPFSLYPVPEMAARERSPPPDVVTVSTASESPLPAEDVVLEAAGGETRSGDVVRPPAGRGHPPPASDVASDASAGEIPPRDAIGEAVARVPSRALCATPDPTARWLSWWPYWSGRGKRGSRAASAPNGAHNNNILETLHEIVCWWCVVTSLMTLCGLDVATCAHLLLALLALAAVFLGDELTHLF